MERKSFKCLFRRKESNIDGNIEIPEVIIVCDNDARVSQDELIKYVYHGIRDKHNDHTWLMERCILSPHNYSVN